MALSYVKYVGDGATTHFSVSFPYINPAYVLVAVDGVLTNFTWLTAGTIEITPAPPDQALVHIFRQTLRTNRLVNFEHGSFLTEKQLNLEGNQQFHIMQEIVDGQDIYFQRDLTGAWDAEGDRIINVGAPTEANDAATKEYVNALLAGQSIDIQQLEVENFKSGTGEINTLLSNSAEVGVLKSAVVDADFLLFGNKNIGNLLGLTKATHGDTLVLGGYYTPGDGGGGVFYWDAACPKTEHDGGLVIDNDHTKTPGSAGWWDAENVGNGCWRRAHKGSITVKDFGAVGDAAFDCTKAFTKALNCVVRDVFIPVGSYLLDTVTVANPLNLYGAPFSAGGGGGSVLLQKTANTDVLVFDCSKGPHLSNFMITSNFSTPTEGTGIVLKDSTPVTTVPQLWARINNVIVDNLYRGISIERGCLWTITDCVFWNMTYVGITVNNTYDADQGDGSISACTFHGRESIGILWLGGGGMRVTNSKFLHLEHCIRVNAYAVAQQTAQLLITGNSFDMPYDSTVTTTVISIANTSGSLAFGDIIINNNLFIAYTSLHSMIDIVGTAASNINRAVITGNAMTQPAGTIGGGGAHIYLDHMNHILVTANSLRGNGTGSGGTPISVGSGVNRGTVQGNEIRSYQHPIWNAGSNINVNMRTRQGVAVVGDGASITHGLDTTPLGVSLTTDLAATTANAFSLGSSTFNVALRDTTGSSIPGTCTVFWTAWV
jgi:hypothetical protein